MATKTIADYTAAVSIDPSNDYFLLEQGGAYLKINRSVTLGITGSPVGTSDAQTLSNKIVGNTNTITVKDGSFTLQNSSDTTKQVQFSLAGLTSGATRTITLPNATATLATLAGVETLTNKSITGAAISGGTIDNSTITVDSISGHTTPTLVTVGGVQLNNGVISTANSVTATSIAAGGVQPNALTAGTGTGWSWTTFSPVWTNLTVGNGTVESKYVQTGKTVHGRTVVTFGTTTSVSGAVSFTLPVANASTAGVTGGMQMGTGTALIAGTLYGIFPLIAASNTAIIRTFGVGSTYPTHTDLSSMIPGTWANTSVLAVEYFYEAS